MKTQCRRVWPYALTVLLAGAILVMAPGSSWANHQNGDPNAGHPSPYGPGNYKPEDVRTTIHNLGTSNPIAGSNIAAGINSTSEVCVFCHTPHGANTSAPGAAPLWNRALPVTTGYTMYSAPNFDGVSAQGAPVGVSLACLSCHDGTVGLDALINGPGSGNFRPTNLGTPAAPGDTTLSLVGTTTDFVDSDHSMSETQRTDTGSNYSTITGGAAPFPNLTQNLSDDHPISMQMPTTAIDPQFDATRTTDGQIVKLTRDGTTYADKRDAIRLYPPSGENFLNSREGWVECASCHNPHAPRPLVLRLPGSSGQAMTAGGNDLIPATWGGDGTTYWGQNPNSGSAVCLTCHNK
jgi:hypothetical protein